MRDLAGAGNKHSIAPTIDSIGIPQQRSYNNVYSIHILVTKHNFRGLTTGNYSGKFPDFSNLQGKQKLIQEIKRNQGGGVTEKFIQGK